jgi:iron complex transport system substrate-binding protein
MRCRRLLGPLLAVVLVVAACSSGSPSTERSSKPGEDFPVTLTDDNGTRVTIDHEPHRIVTFAPSITETLFALGIGDEVVGVSGPADDFPSAARDIPEIGAGELGVEPNVEEVVSLRADLFFYAFTGTPPWMKRLRDLGVPVFTLLADDLTDAFHDIGVIGQLTGTEDRAAALVNRMAHDDSEIEQHVANETEVSCFFETGFVPAVYTVGPGALIYDLMQRAGCDPVTSGAKSAYPQWSVEALVEADPDVYFVASDAVPSESVVGKRPGFGDLSAVANDRVFRVNADVVTRPGPRMIRGLEVLARLLHPGAFT